jgi:photosystem II stability/assembly factor-like uncharacterized protein
MSTLRLRSMFNLRIIFILLICLCFQTANAAWTKQNSNTLSWLHDVYFASEKTGWIAGSDGVLLKTSDGGKTWRQEKKFTEDNLKQIHFSDEKNGWVLCERSIYNRGSQMSSYLVKTSDGGVNWEKFEFDEGTRERITRILFNQYGFGLAFGEGGAFFTFNQTEGKWQRNAAPVRYLLLDGFFTDNFNGVIVGAGGTILFTEDAGTNWNQANIFGDKTAKLSSVFFYNQKTGWTVGANGKIFQTSSGGKTWREQTSGTAKNLNDVAFLNSAEGFTVGDDGTILHTKTAGNIWQTQISNSKHKLEKVYFFGKKGFAVGFGGTILIYDESEKLQRAENRPILRQRNY